MQMIDRIENSVKTLFDQDKINIDSLKIIPETPYWAMVGIVNNGECEVQYQVHNDSEVRILIPLQLEDWGVFNISNFPDLDFVKDKFAKLDKHRIEGDGFNIYYYDPYHCLTTTINVNDVDLSSVVAKMVSTYADLLKKK